MSETAAILLENLDAVLVTHVHFNQTVPLLALEARKLFFRCRTGASSGVKTFLR